MVHLMAHAWRLWQTAPAWRNTFIFAIVGTSVWLVMGNTLSLSPASYGPSGPQGNYVPGGSYVQTPTQPTNQPGSPPLLPSINPRNGKVMSPHRGQPATNQPAIPVVPKKSTNGVVTIKPSSEEKIVIEENTGDDFATIKKNKKDKKD